MSKHISKLRSQQGHILLCSIATLLLTATVGTIIGYYAVSVHSENDIQKYHKLMENMDATVEAIKIKAGRMDPIEDIGKLRRKKLVNNMPELKILVDRDAVLRLEGIAFQQGRPVALVNDRIMQLNEEIGRYRIIHIGNSSVLFVDEAGETREISIYDELDKYKQD